MRTRAAISKRVDAQSRTGPNRLPQKRADAKCEATFVDGVQILAIVLYKLHTHIHIQIQGEMFNSNEDITSLLYKRYAPQKCVKL